MIRMERGGYISGLVHTAACFNPAPTANTGLRPAARSGHYRVIFLARMITGHVLKVSNGTTV